MRIVGGEWRGRVLPAPSGSDTRPTSDRARETLFNMIAHDPDSAIDDARVLDGFAGTGAIGFEALSRGASHCTFIDNGAEAVRLIGSTASMLGCADRASILRHDLTRPPPPPARMPHDLVFLDPPYGQGLAERALRALIAASCLAPNALVVVEEAAGASPQWPDGLRHMRERKVGAARFHFLRAEG